MNCALIGEICHGAVTIRLGTCSKIAHRTRSQSPRRFMIRRKTGLTMPLSASASGTDLSTDANERRPGLKISSYSEGRRHPDIAISSQDKVELRQKALRTQGGIANWCSRVHSS